MSIINYYGPISDNIGYGIAGHEILKSICKKREVIYWPVGQPSVAQNQVELIQKCLDNREKYKTEFNTLTIWHQNSLQNRIGCGINAALSFFEKNSFTDLEIEHLKTQDILFAPSKWAFDIFTEHKLNSIYVPMGVDSELFKPVGTRNASPYRFFNIGKLEKRKGHDILCDIFNAAFTKDDDVELWISWNNPFLSEEEQKKIEGRYLISKLGEKINFIPRINRYDLVNLYNSIDCGIFPTRAEGCGLPIMEMLSCAKPIITTNYSAITDFCNSNNSLLVEIDTLEKCEDGKWFNGFGEWAHFGSAQIDQFISYMRSCYKTRYNYNFQGRNDMEKLSWDNTADAILEVI